MTAHDMVPDSVRVVLLCAEPDEGKLAGLVAELHTRGIYAEIVGGLAERPRAVGKLLDDTAGQGVFIVVESDHLDRAAHRRIEGYFSARRGPQHVLIDSILDIEPADHLGERIEDAIAASAVASRAETTPLGVTKPKPRDVVDMSAIGNVTPTGGVPSRAEMKRQKAAAEAPTPKNRDITDEIAFEDLYPHEREGAQGEADDSESDEVRGSSRASSSRRTRTATASSVADRGRSRRLMIYGAVGLGAVGLATVATVFLASPSEGRDANRQADVARGAPEHDVAAASLAEPIPSVEDADAAAGPGALPPVPDAATTPGDADGTAVVPPAPGVVLGGGTDAAESIAAAIEAGELRAIDLIVAAPPSDGSLNWLGASNFCKKASFADVGQWRLPTKEELWSLRSARIVPATGTFWSSTLDLSDDDAAENKDRILGLEDGRIVGIDKLEVGPRAVCVRKR